MKLKHACLACSALLFSASAFAYGGSSNTDTDTSGYFAAGVGTAPAFVGADEYEAIPLFFGDFEWRGMGIQVNGPRLRFDLIDNGPLTVGPIIAYHPKRDSSDGSGRVRYLSDVKSAAEIGGFINYAIGGASNGQGQVTLDLSGVHDINNAYDGLLITGGVSYAALRSRALSVDIDARTTWGDDHYQQTYFGISHRDSARSGLPTYRPDSGFRDVTVGVSLSHQFNRQWGVIARGSVTHFVDDTAHSPIIREGSRTVGLLGLAVSYRF